MTINIFGDLITLTLRTVTRAVRQNGILRPIFTTLDFEIALEVYSEIRHK